MSTINLKACPNCGVHAIRIEPNTKPNDEVECNNCHFVTKRKNLNKKH